MKIVGINVKRRREELGLGLRELAKKLQVSASLLSQIERGKASPSLATLKNIADSLQTTIGNLVGENQTEVKDEANNFVVREQDRRSMKGIGSGMKMFLLTSPDPNKQMEPLLFKLKENAHSGTSLYKHFGQEFILVLRGAVEISLNETKYILKKGDSIYFNSNIPHSFKNVYKGITEALWVDTPPTF